MTERRDIDPFETRFAEHVRAYTDPATERRIDSLAVSRAAMSSQQAAGWLQRRLGGGSLRRGVVGARWGAGLAAIVLIGVLGIAVLGRPSDTVGPQPTPSPAPSATGPVPEALRHSWQRPYAVTPDLDQWPSGFLSLESGALELRPEPSAVSSGSTVVAAGLDTLVATSTAETLGCAIGDIGAYRWSVEGQGTVMTLTAIGADACAGREVALAGTWVRADLPGPQVASRWFRGRTSRHRSTRSARPMCQDNCRTPSRSGGKSKRTEPGRSCCIVSRMTRQVSPRRTRSSISSRRPG